LFSKLIDGESPPQPSNVQRNRPEHFSIFYETRQNPMSINFLKK
jgi:hypothetical protein